MTTKERYERIKNGLGKQVVVKNGKATISKLDNSASIISLAAKALAENDSKKVTYLVGRGRYVYGTLNLSDTGSSQEVEELEGRVSSLENEYNTLSETVENVYELLHWIEI